MKQTATTPDDFPSERFVLDGRQGRRLDARPGAPGGPVVMGILNVTPDSFSDGGQFFDRDDALRRAGEMLREGAQIIDVGGESSRPSGSVYGEGAEGVPADEERRRVVPVVRGIAERFPDAVISVDTYKPTVAEAVLEAGAHIINDVTALRVHPETAEIVAEAGAALIVMHALGRPGAMPHEHHYDDVLAEVTDALAESVERAENAGVESIVVDPGFGFGKTPQENLLLLRRTDALLDQLERPVMVGISRKSTIGAVLGENGEPAPVGERLYGSLGATAAAVTRGASLVRTHDVRATREMLHGLAAVVFS